MTETLKKFPAALGLGLPLYATHTAFHLLGAPTLIQLWQLESRPVPRSDLCSRSYFNLSNANVNVSEIRVCRAVSFAFVERARRASCRVPLAAFQKKKMQLKLEINTVAVFNECLSIIKRSDVSFPMCLYANSIVLSCILLDFFLLFSYVLLSYVLLFSFLFV